MLPVYIIKLQQSHWSFLPVVVFWAPVQEHRQRIPVTTSAQFSLPGDGSGNRWAKDLYQHVSSETAVPVPHSSSPDSSRLSWLPPALVPGSWSSAWAGSGKRWMLPDSNQPSGKFTRMRGKHMVCLTHSPCAASAAPAAPTLHAHTLLCSCLPSSFF